MGAREDDRLKLPLLVAALLVTPLALHSAGAFHRDDLPLVHRMTVLDGESRAARLVSNGGTLAVDVDAWGPMTGAQGSIGVSIVDADGNRRSGVTYARLGSPDRVFIVPLPGEDGATPTVVVREPSAADGVCTFLCLGIQTNAVPAGEIGVVVWAAGIPRADFDVRIASGGAFEAEAVGTALTTGDYGIDASGAPNVQVHRVALGHTLGVKVMKDARFPTTVERGLFGVWYNSDFKTACQFALSRCVYENTVKNACLNDLRTNCDTTRMGWTGPTGGHSGRYIYSFDGEPAGDWSFNVDLKLDVYGPRTYEATSGTFLYAGEDYSILSIADVAVP